MKKNVGKALTWAAAMALAGCVSSQDGGVPQSPPATGNEAMLRSSGLNVGTAQGKVSKVGYDNLVDAGLTVGMTQSMGGFGLAGGLLGMIASPGAGLEGSPHILTTVPAGQNPKAREARYSEAVYRASGLNLEANGYERVSEAAFPNYVIFAKPGCPITSKGYHDRKCSKVISASVYKPQGAPAGDGYMVNFNIGQDVRDHEALARRIVDQVPSELSLYLPPRKIAGEWQPPRLYQRGRETVLK